MAIRAIEANMNVVEASRIRIKNAFDTGLPIYLSFSAGKDSLCMSHLVYELILKGEINPKQLTVIFIDEETIYPSMVDAAERWRKKFLSVGAQFNWYCLPFKQVSVIDHLSSSESWITWDSTKENVWIRRPPEFAIRTSPYIRYEGEMNYQHFCNIAFRNGISMIGLRTSESIQRLKNIASMKNDICSNGNCYPIYDWKDNDIWLYIKERNLEFPEIYIHLYEAGVSKRHLRLCVFFGDSSTEGLRWIVQTDPELWEKIQKREPNAYLVLLYWDSEMFGRDTKARKKLEEKQEKKDYKFLCKDILFLNPNNYTIAKDTKARIGEWKTLYTKFCDIMTEGHYKKMYESLMYGDPKSRALRSLYNGIYADYVKDSVNGKR